MARVVFLQAALNEARDARVFLRDREPKTVEGFRARLSRARSELRRFPEAGPAYLFGARRLQLAPYPYFLVYKLQGDLVVIVAVPHTSQSEGYWRDR